MAYINVELDNFDTEDLLEELEYRGERLIDNKTLKLIDEIYQKKLLGQDYSDIVTDLIWHTIGRVA